MFLFGVIAILPSFYENYVLKMTVTAGDSSLLLICKKGNIFPFNNFTEFFPVNLNKQKKDRLLKYLLLHFFLTLHFKVVITYVQCLKKASFLFIH